MARQELKTEAAPRRRPAWSALAVALGIGTQFVLGLLLHAPAADTSPGAFRTRFQLHLLVALITLACASWLFVSRWRRPTGSIRGPAMLVGLLAAQSVLCATAWVANYGLPVWFIENVRAVPFTVVAAGPLQLVVRVAVIGTALSGLALSLRLAGGKRTNRHVSP